MPALEAVTPVVLTLDEAPNIGRCLDRLKWADRVVVLDSGSEDGTEEIVRSYANTDFLVREFDTHARQWNYGLEQVETAWTLALDADYMVPWEVVEELGSISDETSTAGFFAKFDYVVLGSRLSRSLYPPRQVLFRTDRAVFEDDGHAQRVQVDGSTGHLEGRILHDDRKPFGRWLRNQAQYARREAEKLDSTPWRELSLPDHLRRTRVLSPPAVFLYCLFAKGLILKGWPGWCYTLERTVAECSVALALLRRNGN
jgi:glycosyltransferase involved in cell wall biosynthesis